MNGITIDINPIIFHFGPLSLRWYSLTFMAGLLLAAWLIIRGARRAGLDADKVGNVSVWAIVAGLVGARLFHILDNLGFYLDNPEHMVMVNHGGLAIWGGLLAGGVVAFLMAWKEGIPTLRLADIAVVGLIPGQIVGRIGCLINGDAWGGQTGLPWGLVYVNPGAMLPDELRGVPTHPYPVYEALWNAALLGVLLMLRRRKLLPDGGLFLIYGAGYALGRLGLTFVRQEAPVLWGLQQAQVFALGAMALAGIGMLILLRRPRRKLVSMESPAT